MRFAATKTVCFRWLLPAATGVLLAGAFPPFDAFQLGWVGLIPLFFSVATVGRAAPSPPSGDPLRRGEASPPTIPWGEAFRRGYIAGLVFFGATLWWIGHVTVPGVVSVIAFLALYFGAAAVWFSFVTAKLFRGRTTPDPTAPRKSFAATDSPARNLLTILLVPTGWVALEWVRSHFLMGGFGWNLLGTSQAKVAPLFQFANITGVYGVSALLCAVNVTLYLTAVRFITNMRAGQPIRRLSWELYLVMIGIGIVAVHGAREVKEQNNAPKQTLRIALVQADIPQSLKFVPEQKAMVLQRHRELTETAIATKPDLIIWPETAAPEPLLYDPASFELATSIVAQAHAPLLTGTIDFQQGSSPPLAYNAAVLLKPDGTVAQTYRKIHLVPFGEYVPLQRFTAGLLKRIGPAGYDVTEGYGFQTGKEYTVFETAGVRFGAVICFEDTVPHLYRRFVQRGANFMVNLTNDAWFKKSPAARIHFANAVFRAIETHRPLVRCTNNGITGVVDASGVVRVQLDPFTEGALSCELAVPTTTGQTFYVQHGDVFVGVCAAVAGLAIGLALLLKLKGKHS